MRICISLSQSLPEFQVIQGTSEHISADKALLPLLLPLNSVSLTLLDVKSVSNITSSSSGEKEHGFCTPSVSPLTSMNIVNPLSSIAVNEMNRCETTGYVGK